MSEVTDQAFEIEIWFESEFWPTYPRDLCNRIGSKSKALASAIKHIKNKEKADIVISGLREQMRYFRKIKKTGAHGSEWKMGMCVTWLNGEHWADEIPSHYELGKRLETRKCRCGNDVEVSDLCMPCYEKIVANSDWRIIKCREYFVANGLKQQATETRNEWLVRLRNVAKQQIMRIGS